MSLEFLEKMTLKVKMPILKNFLEHNFRVNTANIKSTATSFSRHFLKTMKNRA